MLNQFIKKIFPESVLKFLKLKRRAFLENKYFNQTLKSKKTGNYNILAPKGHLILNIDSSLELRDICVGISAKFICNKYKNSSIMDIGANIGDTAAIISTFVPNNKLILVEASNYFFELLKKNTAQLPNEKILLNGFVADGTKVVGGFIHWAGTAEFVEGYNSVELQSKKISEIADNNTHFIKSDTDGFDFRILQTGMDWFSSSKAAVLYENQIKSEQDFIDANYLLDSFYNIGYSNFILWDNNGYLLLATNSIEAVKNLNFYLYVTCKNNYSKKITNYDILCLHKDDVDVYNEVYKWYRDYNHVH